MDVALTVFIIGAVAFQGRDIESWARGRTERTRLTTDYADDTDKENAPVPIREIRVIRGQKTPWRRLVESQGLPLGLELTVLINGATAFQVRDIKS